MSDDRRRGLPRRPASLRIRKVPTLVLALLPAVLTGCEVPTGSPILESTWLIPAEGTSIGVADLLPSNVSVSADGTTFDVEIDPTTVVETLADICDLCTDDPDVPVPKPAFQARLSAVTSLPADVEAVELLAGTVRVRATHDFSFDPLRPGGGNTGALTFSIRNGGEEGPIVGSATVEGSRRSFAPGETLSIDVELQEATLSGDIFVVTRIDSPSGDPTPLDLSSSIEIRAEPSDVPVAAATIDVAGEDVSIDPVGLDVDDVDDTVVDEVRGGAFVIGIVNDFGVPVDATLRVEGPGLTPISKPFDIPATPTSTVRVEFSGEELRSFLGQSGVIMTGSGQVPPGTSSVVLTPGLTVEVDADAEITLRIGE